MDSLFMIIRFLSALEIAYGWKTWIPFYMLNLYCLSRALTFQFESSIRHTLNESCIQLRKRNLVFCLPCRILYYMNGSPTPRAKDCVLPYTWNLKVVTLLAIIYLLCLGTVSNIFFSSMFVFLSSCVIYWWFLLKFFSAVGHFYAHVGIYF